MDSLTSWPWLNRLIWTAATVAIALGLGLLINTVVVRRLQSIANRTRGTWDDAVVRELRSRIPLWSLLIGLWLSISYWPVHERWTTLASNLITVLAVLSVTLAVAAIAVRLLTDLAPRVSPSVQVSGLTRNLVRLVILTVGILVLLRGIGVEITPMLAALGVGGLAVALALQDPLANLFAGVFVTLAGQIRMGDYIKIEGGPEGFVADFKWHATQLRSLGGNLIFVPNAKLSQAIVTNYDRPTPDVGVSVEFTVAADADLRTVERLALDAAKAVLAGVPGTTKTDEPSVRFQGFSDFGVRCAVAVRGQQFADQFLLKHELIKRVQAALKDAGIDMPTLSSADRRAPRRHDA